MEDTGGNTNSGETPHTTDSILITFTTTMTEAQVSTPTTENSTAPIGIKLDGSNYGL